MNVAQVREALEQAIQAGEGIVVLEVRRPTLFDGLDGWSSSSGTGGAAR